MVLLMDDLHAMNGDLNLSQAFLRDQEFVLNSSHTTNPRNLLNKFETLLLVDPNTSFIESW